MNRRLLYLTRESHRTFRPDVAILFGKTLPKFGICSDLVALEESGPLDEWPGGRQFLRRASSKVGRALSRLLLSLDLYKIGKNGRYSAIQVRDLALGALVGLVAARILGLPFFYWMSFPLSESWQDMGAGKEASSGTFLQRLSWRVRGSASAWLLYEIVLPRSQHIFVQSEAMKAALVEKGLRSENMTSVPMGVEIPNPLPPPCAAKSAEFRGRRVLVYLGALERVRRPEIMVHAMAEVVTHAPDALLVLVGDSQIGGERLWLEGEIRKLGLEGHVLITGWLPIAKAWEYLSIAKIGLSPFPRTRILEVASPTKVCEYLAHEVPVVANDQPDQAHLVEVTGGGICVPLTPEGFSQGILKLLADPERARAMGKAGRTAIERLRGYQVIGASLAEKYNELLPAVATA
jgi:glycosyltransferase involved in cell wall biosynthesis